MNPTLSLANKLERIADLATTNLTSVIAIDSQSDEASTTIPSTAGQKALSLFLKGFFSELGYSTEQDSFANLLVTIPSNSPQPAPKIALMVHMDTSEGTRAVSSLDVVPAWNGSQVRYSKNASLTVSVERYPHLAPFVGHDLLHGPGEFPVGLDDKVGMAELMTLAQLVKEHPEIVHGEILLAFRPDEEIGRMEAVQGLAEEFSHRAIQYGYTIDGVTPFEVNIENFNASLATLSFSGTPLALEPRRLSRLINLKLTGVNTHGATAKAEGHLNSTVIFSHVMRTLGEQQEIAPVYFTTDTARESDARIGFLLRGDQPVDLEQNEATLLASFQQQLAPHAWKGAACSIMSKEEQWTGEPNSGALIAAQLINDHIHSAGPTPCLAEDSAGFEGYSNPFSLETDGAQVTIKFRLRAFTREELSARERHVTHLFEQQRTALHDATLDIHQQYINMGEQLKQFPELVQWASDAAHVIGKTIVSDPIRGGTGIDPFLEKKIPLANLGTGYFAPESEKEITSRQMLAEHTLWLASLVQVIAACPAHSKV